MKDLPKIDYTMVHQYVVEIGSLWDYNRELDSAQHTKALKVKSIKEWSPGHVSVTFEQKMPFNYDIRYFDGRIFKPHRNITIKQSAQHPLKRN